MTKFIDSPYVETMREVTYQSYLRYWDERNGGNVSCRLTAEEASPYEDVHEVKSTHELGFDASALAGQYYLVTGTGRYFRNVTKQPLLDLALIEGVRELSFQSLRQKLVRFRVLYLRLLLQIILNKIFPAQLVF